SACLRGVGVDSEHQGNGSGKGVPVSFAGTSDAGTAHDVFIESENESARKNRTRRQAGVRTCESEPSTKKAERRTGAATLWTKPGTIRFPDAVANSDACAECTEAAYQCPGCAAVRRVSQSQWRSGESQ